MRRRSATSSAPVVALLTDFGTGDHYVASMKGVLLSHNPNLRIIDISHHIEPGRIASAGFTLWAVRASLPPGSVCIAVVDPGVGTGRDILCAVIDGRTYLAPDNGLLDKLLAVAKDVTLLRISRAKVSKMLPKHISATFHGRDIFAPIGAHLATGTTPDNVGVPRKFVRPPEWRVLRPGSHVQPAIMAIDRFGNIITNIVASDAGEMRRTVRAVSIGKVMVSVIVTTFEESPANTPCIIVGSSGLVEIIIKNGSAADMLRINDRTAIRIIWSGEMVSG